MKPRVFNMRGSLLSATAYGAEVVQTLITTATFTIGQEFLTDIGNAIIATNELAKF